MKLENYAFYKESPAHVGPFKYAVDIATPLPEKKQTIVYAPQSGYVIRSVMGNTLWGDGPEFEGYLNYVTILTDQKDEFYELAHIAPLNGKELVVGERVKQGAPLGIVGLNGWITMYRPDRPASHLHMLVGKITNTHTGFESLKIRWNNYGKTR